jgi:MFS family permease
MKTKALQTRNVIFWALVVIFAALVASPCLANWLRFWEYKRLLLAVIAVVFFALAIALLVLTVKLKERGIRKVFFILMGASAAGIPIFAILHNVVYGLFFHGKDGDEAVFFILAVLVCPALFIIGVLGSIVLLISARLRKKES